MMKAGMAMEKAPHNILEETKVTEAYRIPPHEMELPRCTPTGVSSTSSGRRRPPIIHLRWYHGHGIEDEGCEGDDEEMASRIPPMKWNPPCYRNGRQLSNCLHDLVAVRQC